MCVSNQFFSEKVRARAKTKHKPEKIHTIDLAEYYCFNACSFHSYLQFTYSCIISSCNSQMHVANIHFMYPLVSDIGKNQLSI